MHNNTGKAFESLVAKIYAILSSSDANTNVQLDVELDSPDGPRQFDVVIRSQVAGIEIITVVEVRDWNKNLSVTHVDGLHSKMNDVRANKAILVARKGFSSGARKKAARLGIDLCLAHDLQNIEAFVPKAPVVVHSLEFDFTHFDVKARMGGQATTIDFTLFKVDGFSALELFRSDLASQRYVPKVFKDRDALERLHTQAKKTSVGQRRLDLSAYGEYLNVWSPPPDSKITYIDPGNGLPADVAEFNVLFLMRYDYYFGYLNDLPGTFALDSISSARANIFFLEEDLMAFEKHFSQFTRKDDLPVGYAVNVFSLSEVSFELLPKARYF